MKKVSLADIAESLGVSKTLVSMVLNGKGNENGISAKTQERVLKKVKEMNYKPNQIARGLRMGRTFTIGLIVADISNRFYSRICRAAEDEGRRRGYNIMFCSSEENSEIESDLISTHRDRQVDGLIIASTLENKALLAEMRDDKYPFVLIDRHIPDFDSNYVVADNKKGSYDAVNHLIKEGKKNIAVLKIGPSQLSSINDRVDGYKEALADNGIKFNPDLVREIPFNNVEDAVATELKSLLIPSGKVDAIYVLNNNVAISALKLLKELNISIPKTVSFVSFDDIDLFSLVTPNVTAVSQPVSEIGREAVKALIAQIEHKGDGYEYKQTVLQPELIIRESSSVNIASGGVLA